MRLHTLAGTGPASLKSWGCPFATPIAAVSAEGFLNLGGFVQYTLVADVPNQFLVTGGMRSGSSQRHDANLSRRR